jgi:MFS family permease
MAASARAVRSGTWRRNRAEKGRAPPPGEQVFEGGDRLQTIGGYRGPLAESYPGAVALVVCALVPFLTLVSAVLALTKPLVKSVGASRVDLEVAFWMASGAYAFGTVLAVQFAQHLPARRMLLVYLGLFVVATTLGAWAPAPEVFLGAFVAEGLLTSLLLIAAVPPLVTGWPARKLPFTAMIMNLCIFGAVAAGPVLGGLEAAAGIWRPLFAGVAGLALLALIFGVLTFEDVAPQDQTAPWDFVAIGLAAIGCAAAFFGAAQLESLHTASVPTVLMLAGGAALIVLLVVHQYRERRPLMPVRELATAFPVFGILIALSASAAGFGLMALGLEVPRLVGAPAEAAVLFLPELGAAIIAAVSFGVLYPTRYTPLLALAGLASLVVAAALFIGVASASPLVTALGAGLLGFGVGASVSPALFLAGLSLRSSQIQRVFALIELLRGVAAFLLAPVLLYLVTVLAATTGAGTARAVWICLGVAVAGGIGASAIFLASRGRLQTPSLERWVEGEPAWESPPLFSGLGGRAGEEG